MSEIQIIGRVEQKDIADASTDILDEDVTVTEEGGGLLVVVSLDTDTTLELITDLSDGTRITDSLNEGNTLGAGNEWNFSLVADPKWAYNFQVGATAQVKKLLIKEVPKSGIS